MQLQLEKNAYVDRDFVNWLLLKIPYAVLSQLTAKKFHSARQLLKDADINIDPRRIILAGCRCMHVIELKDTFIIDIRRRVVFSSTKRTVRDLCSMIEYGNMHTPGTYVFTSAFNYIKESLPRLYSEYMSELI